VWKKRKKGEGKQLRNAWRQTLRHYVTWLKICVFIKKGKASKNNLKKPKLTFDWVLLEIYWNIYCQFIFVSNLSSKFSSTQLIYQVWKRISSLGFCNTDIFLPQAFSIGSIYSCHWFEKWYIFKPQTSKKLYL